MQLSLRTGTKLYLNGAVIRVDRKVNVELLNEAVFLLENHVMQFDQATTPFRQLYFVIQSILMAPETKADRKPVLLSMLKGLITTVTSERVAQELTEVSREVTEDKFFATLKRVRKLYLEGENEEETIGKLAQSVGQVSV